MLRDLKKIKGYKIATQDDDVGTVEDFLFDDRAWTVRYIVVDTGTWLPGRRVLIGSESIGAVEHDSRSVQIDLTKQQIEKGPPLEFDKPVSSQQEAKLREHFGWPSYWAGIGVGLAGVAVPAIPTEPEGAAIKDQIDQDLADEGGNPHLRSLVEVAGYHIQAQDGEIGHVESALAEDKNWAVRYFVVDTRNWLPGRKVLISPEWAKDISWTERILSVDMTKEKIKNSPEYNSESAVDRDYEHALFDYYALMPYWTQP